MGNDRSRTHHRIIAKHNPSHLRTIFVAKKTNPLSHVTYEVSDTRHNYPRARVVLASMPSHTSCCQLIAWPRNYLWSEPTSDKRYLLGLGTGFGRGE